MFNAVNIEILKTQMSLITEKKSSQIILRHCVVRKIKISYILLLSMHALLMRN